MEKKEKRMYVQPLVNSLSVEFEESIAAGSAASVGGESGAPSVTGQETEEQSWDFGF